MRGLHRGASGNDRGVSAGPVGSEQGPASDGGENTVGNRIEDPP